MKMGNEITFEFWLISFLGMFILVVLLFTVGHFIIGLMHPPFVKKNAFDGLSVYIYHLSRTRRGSYSEYVFVYEGNKWKYRVDRERLWITIVLFAMMMIPFFYFVYVKTGMPFKSFAKIMSIISEAFIIPMFYDPVYAYIFLRRTQE